MLHRVGAGGMGVVYRREAAWAGAGAGAVEGGEQGGHAGEALLRGGGEAAARVTRAEGRVAGSGAG